MDDQGNPNVNTTSRQQQPRVREDDLRELSRGPELSYNRSAISRGIQRDRRDYNRR